MNRPRTLLYHHPMFVSLYKSSYGQHCRNNNTHLLLIQRGVLRNK